MPFDLDILDASPWRQGWLEVRLISRDGSRAPRLLVKVGKRDGRIAVVRLVLDGHIGAQTFRDIPLGRFEAWLNTQFSNSGRTYGEVLAERQTDGMDAETLDNLKQRKMLFPEEFERIDESLDRYLEHTVKERHSPIAMTEPREKLTRPDGSDPDAFSYRVAEAYKEAVISTSKPAVALAEEAGVPVTTVHRWIREARQRGHLPKAKKGRAG